MRVWDIDPHLLCNKHLVAEHGELHGVWNVLVKNGGRGGYSRHPETLRWQGKLRALYERHEALCAEMARRGFAHRTPLDSSKASGLAHQDEFVNSIQEQEELLRAKGCDCFSEKLPAPAKKAKGAG